MNERVAKLREQSVSIQPYISSERAELITEFYKSNIPKKVSIPVCRAMAFKYLMQNKTICINDGELIVGERGPAPKATPTFPEQCTHSLEDLVILNKRKKTPFLVSEQVKQVYKDKIIPFWSGKSMREKVFAAMNEKWQEAFKAGLFTEFMEQRAPGHAILDDRIYYRGMLDFKQDIAESLSKLDFTKDPDAHNKQQELLAMDICADSIIIFANRYAEKAKEIAKTEGDPDRKEELKKIAEICRQVPANAPRNFHEALQSYWFVHLGVITELNLWDSFNPGRLDLNLQPFYEDGLEKGELTVEKATELLQCFWIKFNNHPAPPKVGVTEEQSGTYQDFALINVGGVKPEDGSDAVNELSYLILDVIEEMELPQPSTCIQLSKKNPDRFLHRACKVIRKGFGQPSVFNTDVIINEFLGAGKNIRDARAGGAAGCVEIAAFGKESSINTGYLNWGKIFELACNNGVDPAGGEQLGPQTGDALKFTSFDKLMNAYKKQLQYFVDLKVEGNNIIERLYADYLPQPFLSILIDDCIGRGLDYNNGGALYDTTYIEGVGLATVTDSLSAVRLNVFERKAVTMSELLNAMAANFEGFEALRQMLLKQTPFYGNDDDYADDIAKQVFNAYYDAVEGRCNSKGGKYHINILPTTSHVYFGSVVGTLPNGRKAGLPISDGISPSQGYDRKGPTAVLKSASKLDHAKTGGTLLNMKFPKTAFDGDNLYKLAHLIRAYFKLDGHHVQFNVIDAKTLKDAQENPEQYRNLIIRVAGFSDYFVSLGKEVQDEIISRTEQTI
jgi:formate C-acetyltransferase